MHRTLLKLPLPCACAQVEENGLGQREGHVYFAAWEDAAQAIRQVTMTKGLRAGVQGRKSPNPPGCEGQHPSVVARETRTWGWGLGLGVFKCGR